MIEKRDLWLVGIAGVLGVGVVLGFHIYDAGKRSVALQSTEDSLAVVVKQREVVQKQRDSIGKALAVAEKKSAESRTVYVHDSGQTKIVGVNAYDSAGKFIQVLDVRIAARIASADTHIARLESELLTAKSLVRVDTVVITKQADETRLNQNIASMVKGSRFSTGLQLGVGVCYGPAGKTGCGYIGYGFSVRLP